ncbi:MAG: hypothetical protein M0Z69_00920 [Actinomycetota bacterium]|nr:hypothetical protein [Actinomycetota bacterium]
MLPDTMAVALCGCLTGSWFLGPEDAWVVQVRMLGGGLGNIVRVDGTTDGGRSWRELPAAALPHEGEAVEGEAVEGEAVAPPSPCPFDHPPVLRLMGATAFLSAGSCTPAGETPSVFRSGDGFRHWARVSLPAPPGGWPATVEVGPAVSTAHELLVAVLARAGHLVVERSTNGGRRWQLVGRVDLGRTSTDPAATFLARTPASWVVPTGLAMAVPTDAGRRWHLEPSNQFAGSGPIAFGPQLVVALASLDGSMRTPALESTDEGRDWMAVGIGEPGLERVLTAFDDAASGLQSLSRSRLVAWGPAGLSVSSSGGRSWSRRLDVPVAVADFLGRTGYVVTPYSLERTVDGARSWRMLREPAPLSTIQFDTPSVGFAGTCTAPPSPLFITHDGGRSWDRVVLPLPWSTTGLCEEQASTSAGAAGGFLWVVAAAGQRRALFESSDGGRHWSKALGTPRVPALLLLAVSGPSAWVAVAQPEGPMNTMGQFFAVDVLVTTDQGRHWRDVLASSAEKITGLPASVPKARPRPLGVPSYPGGPLCSRAVGTGQGLQLAAASPRPGVLWLLSDSQNAARVRFLVTGSAGRSWTTTGPAPFGAAQVVALAAFGSHGAAVLVSSAKGAAVLVSSAKGAAVLVSSAKGAAVLVSSAKGAAVLVSSAKGAAEDLWVTTDGGRRWQRAGAARCAGG